MFTREREWERWAAPRGDLVAAVQLTADEFERWDGVRPGISVRIVYEHGLTEEANNIDVLSEIHPTDLRRIRSVWIDVRPDYRAVGELRDERYRRATELQKEGKNDEAETLINTADPDPKSRASFRVSRTGFEMNVEGEGRTNVDGLTTHLSDILLRQASWPTWFPAEVGWVWPLFLGFLAFWAGLGAALAIEGGSTHHRTHRLAALLAWGALVLVGIALGWILVWAFPTPEILDDGEQARFRRARAQVLGAVLTIVLGVVSIALYAIFG